MLTIIFMIVVFVVVAAIMKYMEWYFVGKNKKK